MSHASPPGRRDDESSGQSQAGTLVNECELAAPPETVWRALTDPTILGAWLMPNDMRPEPGAAFSFEAPADLATGRIDCHVLEAEPPRLLRYSWRSSQPGGAEAIGPPLQTMVTFELFPTSQGGTLLRVLHSGFTRASSGTVAVLRDSVPWVCRLRQAA